MTSLSNKVLEIRDAGTHIPSLATQMLAKNGIQNYYIHGRSGYPKDGSQVILTRLADGSGNCDPYSWGNRTMANAHNYIIDHWDELSDGDVVDVEYLLGESTQPKVSERLTIHRYESEVSQ